MQELIINPTYLCYLLAPIMLMFLKSKNWSPFDPYGLFLLFNMFYIFGLFIYANNELIPIVSDEDIHSLKYLQVASLLGLAGFLSVYLVTDQPRMDWGFQSSPLVFRSRLVFYIFYIFLAFLLCFFSARYGWHAYSRLAINEDSVSDIGYTVFAHAKYLFLCMGLVALPVAIYRMPEFCFIALSQIIIMFFDGSRTTFLGFAVVGILYYQARVKLKRREIFFFGLLTLFLVIAARAVSLDGEVISTAIGSVVFESAYALYSSIQITDAIVNLHSRLLYGSSYIFDPVINFLPQGMRNEYLSFSYIIREVEQVSKFSPMGGFYYVGEAIANFGLFGPALVGGVWCLIIRAVFKIPTRFVFIRLAFFGSLAPMFAKQVFGNGFKVFIFYLFYIFLINRLFVMRASHARTC